MIKCGKKLSFEECEMAVLRSSIDHIDKKKGKEMISNPEIVKIINIVEKFITKKKLICYGGTAINNIIADEDKFYNNSVELPDYDFFSPTPLAHAKELADIYYNNGFIEVEAKSGVHSGTFKVYVNYIPVADITYLNINLFNSLKKKSLKVDKIYYAPPNFLRMSMYLELSRPDGNITRWEKVLKRLNLLNKNYPIKKSSCKSPIDKLLEHGTKSSAKKNMNTDVYKILLNFFITNKCVLFGMYAGNLYNNTYKKKSKVIKKIPDFDILYEDPDELSINLKKKIRKWGIYKY